MVAFQTYGAALYAGECAWYWIVMSFVHIPLFVLGVGVLALASRFWRGRFRLWFIRWTMFNVCLFAAAGLTNGLWSCLIFGRLYWSTDYVVDFSPFWPVTQRTLDDRFGDEVGGLLGISLLQLQALWLLFAVVAWVSAALLSRFVARRAAKRLAPQSV